jgi:N-carbamoyl-L-amino-acid hydrolase
MDEMCELGMTVVRDGAGNTIGTFAGDDAGAPAIATGSHTDTVPDGGQYDGALGVLAGLACVHALRNEGRRLKCNLEVIDFAAEEATLSGGLFGSRAMAGLLDDDVFERVGWGGRRISEHLEDAGLIPAQVLEARRAQGSLAAYVELHIEQGEILEHSGESIGVVEGIVGVRTYAVSIPGRAAHAGTTPMDRRQDALVEASRFVLDVREAAVSGGVVATVGRLAVHPGGSNVVPGLVELSLDMRSLDDERLDQIEARLAGMCEKLGGEFIRQTVIEPTPLSQGLIDVVEGACRHRGLPYRRMSSGAGHDAMCMAEITEVAMIFVPSREGISHAPDEFTELEQCAVGADVLLEVLVEVDEVRVSHDN